MKIAARLFYAMKIAVLLLACSSPLLAATLNDGKHVLVIHSYHAGLSWTDSVMAGIRDAFNGKGDEVQFSVEYLDARRYPDSEMAKRIRALFVAKLEGVAPDLVLVSDNAALDFALAQRERLFAEVPIVFCGINSFAPAMIANHRQITGVVEDVSVVETVALALRLHPATKEIIVLGRASVAADRANRESFVAALPRLPAQLRVSFWDDLPLAELQTRLARLDHRSVVVLNGLITSETGRQLMYGEATKWVTRHTGVPVYSLWDVYLGHGIVGGKLVSAYHQGQLAGEMARRILSGESADGLPVASAIEANRTMFDYRQLERFAIPLSTLPGDAVIINRPDSFYERHQTIVWATAAVVLVLSGLVMLLGITIIRRRRAEEALRQANLVVESSPVVLFRWQAAEGWPVALVSQNVIQFGYTPEELLSGAVPFSSMVHPEDLERVANELKEHSASALDQFQQQYRIVTKAGEVRWVEDHTVVERGVDERISCYQGTIMDITERKRAEAALEESEGKFRDLVEKAIVGVYLIQDGVFQYVNSRFAEMHGYSVAEMTGKMAMDEAIHPEDQPIIAESIQKRLRGEVPTLEASFRIVTKDGEVRDVEIFSTGTLFQGRPAVIGTTVDITERKRAEEALEKRLVALTQPLDAVEKIAFEDLFDLSEIQRLQDLTAEAWGVAALIARPDGSPITRPSNFTHFCSDFIRKTENGFSKCRISDAELGRHNPSGPVIQKCLSAGLWGAGASITVGGRHIGNWLIGQVRNEAQEEERIMAYARELGHDEAEFRKAFLEVPVMSQGQFEQIAHALFALANQLSTIAYQNIQQARFITEQKKAEEALKSAKKWFEDVVEFMPDAILIANENEKIIAWNRAIEDMTGIPKTAILGFDHHEGARGFYGEVRKSLIDLVFVDDEELAAKYSNVKRVGSTVYAEAFTPAVYNNRGAHVFAAVSPFYDEEGKLVGIIESIRDITELKRAEAALRESEEKFRRITENMSDLVCELDTHGTYQYVTPSLMQILGYRPQDFIGGSAFDRIHPEDREHVMAAFDEVVRTGIFRGAEYRHLRVDGNYVWLRSSARSLVGFQSEFLGAIVSSSDITVRKRAEEEARRLRSYLSNIIDSMPSVLVGVDTDGRVTHWNTAAEQATGVGAEQAQGQPLEQVLPAMGRQLEKLRQAMQTRTVETQPKVPRTVDGEVHYEDVTVYPLMSNGVEGAVIRVDDVTERVRIEEMMVQSEKMLSVGGLAAGMAHEINNPLGVILQASQNILRRVSPNLPANVRAAEECGTSLTSLQRYFEGREILAFLEDIRQSGQRAAEIVSNMLSFSRKVEGEGSAVDMAELLDRTVVLAASDYDLKKHYDFRQIEIVRDYHPEVPKVVCQPGKIQQVFLNILRNGAEAMMLLGESGRTPQFTLRTGREAGMVRIEIEDNGPGMDEATRRRVFEPFFTTKPPGSGTGLGLSVSYFIITENHGGTMSVKSKEGVGTRFLIRLPAAGREP